MDIDELISVAKQPHDTPVDSDQKLSQLVRLAEVSQRHVELARQNDPTSETRSDHELVLRVQNDIQKDLTFSIDDALAAYADVVNNMSLQSVVSLLPMMLRLRGSPYSLEDHFPMEPLFRTQLPSSLLMRCGRQVSKSTTFGAQQVVQTATTPYFSSLFVTPLYEQTRRFSSNVVRPFITDSPMYGSLVDHRCEQNVLQRSFRNNAKMHFQYALKSADRVRGISADSVTLDEVQDLVWDLVPIIMETMSASKWALIKAAGTPKTLDNTIERMWTASSQAEWVTRCEACSYYNIASLSHDLLNMIGKETVVCAKCGKPINPRPAFHPKTDKRGTGFWLHSRPDRVNEFPGYHAPQVIFPMHFASPRKWQMLRQKMDPSHTPRHVFINEVLGEAADSGTKLITQADLVQACQLYGQQNRFLEAMKRKRDYIDIAVGVDWGGSTATFGPGRAALLLDPTKATSFTALALVGLKPGGKLDVIYTYRFDIVGNHLEEARACIQAWTDTDSGRGATLFAHDFGGAGAIRETLMIQAGLPIQLVMGLNYAFAPQARMLEFQIKGGRQYWTLDKARSLIFLCQALKSGFVGLPSWDTCKHHVVDFLALVEDVIERPAAANIIRVVRKPGAPDDVAHAINFAAIALWHRHGYPSFSDLVGLEALLNRLDASAKEAAADENGVSAD